MTGPVTAPVIVGVDPGGRHTGIVLRWRDVLLNHWPLDSRDSALGLGGWLNDVVHQVERGITQAAQRVDLEHVIVAVENLNPPTPHMGMTSVTGLIGTAQVIGALHTVPAQVLLVPPGGHGSGPLAAYPSPLRPARGLGRGRDSLRHVRSAWDVAGAAQSIHRLQEARS